MADKITWADKESLVTDPTIAEKNKVTDNNMNEIKSVTNTNADELAEKIVYDENDITENTSMIIEEVPEGSNIPYINSEIAIGSSNEDNRPVWFKKTRNVWPLPYSNTFNGVTLTNNGDGTITLNGTATANADFYVSVNSSDYQNGINYYLSSNINSSDITLIIANYNGNTYVNSMVNSNQQMPFTMNITNDKLRFIIRALSGKTFNNTIIKIQLEKGNETTPWSSVYIQPSIIADNTEFYTKPFVLVTTQNVVYDSSSQDGSAVFTLQFPTGCNASNTIVVSLGWKYHSDTNNEWRFGTIAGSDVKPNPFFVTFNYNNTPGIRVRFDDVEAETTYSADFKIVLMKVE